MQKRQFHSDFSSLREACKRNPRFLSAINHSAMIFPSYALCTWIPKCGCSNIRFSVAVQNGILNSNADIDFIHTNNDLFIPTLLFCYEAKYTFIFLRCPFERLASAFLDKLVSGREVHATSLRCYNNMDHLDFRQNFNFSNFIKEICEMPVDNMNIHWRPQSQFLLFQKYDKYFDLAQITEAKQQLKRDINFDLFDTREYLTHDTSKFSKSHFNEAYHLSLEALANLKKKGIVPSYESMYTRELIDLVSSFYRQDIELYCRHFGKSRFMRRVKVEY